MAKYKVEWEEKVLQTWSVMVEAETEDDAIKFLQSDGVPVEDKTLKLEKDNCKEALINVRISED
jgi:hypothetical protein